MSEDVGDLLYVVRQELGFGVDEWRALPWWQQRNYITGLVRRGKLSGGEDDDGEPDLDAAAAAGAHVERN